MTIRARAGDVLLFEAAADDRVSRFIASVTGSPYSHSAIAVAPGLYAHANAQEGPDVAFLGDSDLTAIALRRRIDLYRPASTLDLPALMSYVAEMAARAAEAPDPPLFSDGDLAGLAILRLVVSARRLPVSAGVRRRLRDALVSAIEDGDRRLFCSEFVYRASRAGGYTPPLPAEPFIPESALPPAPPDLGEEQFFDWLVRHLKEWLAEYDFDEESFKTFDEVWHRVVAAYQRGDAPVGADRANFFVPGDFAAAAAYRLTATWPHGGWGPPAPPPGGSGA